MVDNDVSTFFNNVYDMTNRKLLVFITSKCSDTEDISDIFQDTYMEFYAILVKRGATYIKNSEALLMRLARQKISRYYSKMDRIKNFFHINIASYIDDEPTFDYMVDEFNLEEFVVNNQLIEEVCMFL